MTQEIKPLVSITLPTYNRAYILKQAIDSVCAQIYSHWELVVVDDGSTDNTEQILKTYTDPRIRSVKHSVNKGLAASRNTGIRESRGMFIANLDSDDVWMPQKLERELAVFSAAPANIYVVYSRYERTLGNGRVALLPEAADQRNGDLQRVFLEVNLISMQMALVKKELFDRVGLFDETIPALQDWEFWLRASAYTHFLFLPEVLTKGVVLADSIANNQKKRLRGRELIFNKHEQLFKTTPSAYARHAFTIGHTYALMGEPAHGITYLQKALLAYPFKIKYLLAYILALLALLFRSKTFYRNAATR